MERDDQRDIGRDRDQPARSETLKGLLSMLTEGQDPKFIRINGTGVGGSVGLLLHIMPLIG